MTTPINLLTAATSVSTATQFPAWNDSDTQRVSSTLLLAWLQANLTFTSAKPVQQFAAPTTGQTVTVTTGDAWLLITPAGTLATLTITLPSDRTDGEIVRVTSSQILTALTVGGAGTTVNGAPTAMTANGFFEMAYSATLNAWYRVA
jgi:hypothetical protein